MGMSDSGDVLGSSVRDAEGDALGTSIGPSASVDSRAMLSPLYDLYVLPAIVEM